MGEMLLQHLEKQLNNFFEVGKIDKLALEQFSIDANNETVALLHRVNNKYCLNSPPGYKHNVLQWIYSIFV